MPASPPRAADAAKDLLRNAAHHLMTPDPTADGVVRHALERSLDWTVGDPVLRPVAGRSFEPAFSETAGRSLAFHVKPTGRSLGAADQREIANGAARALIDEHFGAEPLRWFDGKTEAARSRFALSSGYGARYALGLDRNGMTEVQASYEWGPTILDMLPAPIMELAHTAMSLVPGLRPFATTIRCGRMSGGQQVGFEITQETPLDALRPLMEELGMGERHGGLVLLMAFILGARFSLPPSTATLTLLLTPKGPELRLDVNIDALPDAPEQLLPLLRLPLTERPQNLSALDAWMTAMTPDGTFGPGSVTVVSVRVRADMPARLALYLRPLSMDAGLAAPQPAASAEPVLTLTPPAAAQSAYARQRALT